MARSLGADHVVDYAQLDFTHSGQRYDLILGVNAHHSLLDYRRSLTQNGIYVGVGGGLLRILEVLLLGRLMSRIGTQKILFFIADINREDLVFLNGLLERGKLKSVIDRQFPLSDAAAALRYLAEGHAKGKVVLTVPRASGN